MGQLDKINAAVCQGGVKKLIGWAILIIKRALVRVEEIYTGYDQEEDKDK